MKKGVFANLTPKWASNPPPPLRPMARGSVFLVALLVGFLQGAQAADPGAALHASFTTMGPVEFDGATHSGRLASVYFTNEWIPGFQPPGDAASHATLQAHQGTLQYVRYQSIHAHTATGAMTGSPASVRREVLREIDVADSRITVDVADLDGKTAYQFFMPVDEQPVSIAAPAQGRVLLGEAMYSVGRFYLTPPTPSFYANAYASNTGQDLGLDPDFALNMYRPLGIRASYPALQSFVLPGEWAGVIQGATVGLEDGTSLPTGMFVNATSQPEAAAGYGYVVIDWLTVRLIVDDMVVGVHTGPGAWSFGWSDLEGTVETGGTWRDAEGTVSDGSAETRLASHTLEATGPIAFKGRAELVPGGGATARANWTLDGEAGFAARNGETLWGQRSPPLGDLVVTTSVLAVLAGFLGKGLITFLVGRHTPRILRADPLASPTRRRILRLLHEEGTATLPLMHERLRLSSTTLRYQLRILVGLGLLSRASGRQRGAPYVLGAGPSGGSDPSARAIAVIHGHELRAALFQGISASPGLTFTGLREALGRPGLAQSTVSHHLRMLEDAGAIEARWVNGQKAYEACADLQEARRIQSQRYLQALGCTDLLLVGRSANGTRGERKRLERLCDLGLVERQGDGFARSPLLIRMMAPGAEAAA